MTLEDRATELAAGLPTDEPTVRAALARLVGYHVPIEEAVRNVRGDYRRNSRDRQRSVAEITTACDTVSTTVTVVRAGQRPIRIDGTRRVVTEGMLADETGQIPFTAWEAFPARQGDVLEIDRASVETWKDRPELNLRRETSITRVLSTTEGDETRNVVPLENLSPGDRAMTIEVSILETERDTVQGENGESVVTRGVLGDRTARLPFTDWQARGAIRTDRSVRIDNIYVQEYRGVPSLNFSRFSAVESLPTDLALPRTPRRRFLGDLIDSNGQYDVTVVGTIVDIQEGSGLVTRCPQCGRVMAGDRCRSHGRQNGEIDLRAKVIVDDGTGTATAIFDRPATERLIGAPLEATRKEAREANDRHVIAANLSEMMLGQRFRIRGALSIDTDGGTMMVETFESLSADPASTARKRLEEVQR